MVVIVVQDIYGKKRIKKMEKSKRPEEKTVITVSKEELVRLGARASAKLVKDIAKDDITAAVVFVELLATYTGVLCDEMFGEDEDE